MSSRRRGTQLLSSIYRAVEAQLTAAGGQPRNPAQLTSLYTDLLQPQQLTCLRHFAAPSTPLLHSTASIAEVAFFPSALQRGT